MSQAEAIQVTAYGLGTRLKDTTMVEVYADRDPSSWGEAPFARRAALGANPYGQDYSLSVRLGGLVFDGTDAKAITSGSRLEAWYTCPQGVTLGGFEYIGTEANVLNVVAAALNTDDNDAGSSFTSNALTLDGTLHGLTPTHERYGILLAQASATHTPVAGAAFRRLFSALAVYGNHGLTTRTIDASTPDGLYGPDIVANVIGRASGVVLRRNDANTYVIPHCVVAAPTNLEDVVTQVNQYIGNDWGTWGPDSVLDATTNGYFDYKARDTATAHWYMRRSDCDDIALQVELASLYSAVDVVYTDPTTTGQQIATRTTTAGPLADAGITRKATLQGGVLTPAGANRLGDIFLALSSGYAPARGQVKLSATPTHYQRGKLPPWFMRADGSNLRVPDVLPSKDALSLSSAPDRRTTFPIKRVEVDCSGAYPVVSVDVDQTNDQLSVLQARLGLAAQFPTAAVPGSSALIFGGGGVGRRIL